MGSLTLFSAMSPANDYPSHGAKSSNCSDFGSLASVLSSETATSGSGSLAHEQQHLWRKHIMPVRSKFLIAVAFTAMALGGAAHAQGLKQVARIAIPGGPIN